MKQKPTIDPITRHSVEMFLARIAPDYPVVEAWLYGSRARGDAGADSDADVAVILNGPKRRAIDVAKGMAGAEFDIMLETGMMVSALPIAAEDWNEPYRHSNPYLIANIKREGIRL